MITITLLWGEFMIGGMANGRSWIFGTRDVVELSVKGASANGMRLTRLVQSFGPFRLVHMHVAEWPECVVSAAAARDASA